MVREAVVRELGDVLGMECRMEEESVESVLQCWDEAEARRASTAAISASPAAAADVPQSAVGASPSPASLNASLVM